MVQPETSTDTSSSPEPALFSVVVPCYCSGKWLAELQQRVAASFPAEQPYELILVNDASPDGGRTWEAIREVAQAHPEVRGINLQFNVGQFAALMCGLQAARGAWIITMDDDLQHPPEEIPKLIEATRAHPELDCIIGAYEVKHHGLVRNLGSWLVRKTYEWLSGKPRDVPMGSFRAISHQAVSAMLAHKTSRPVIGPLLLSSTRRIGSVPVAHAQRPYAQSGYTLRKLIRTTLDNVFDATTAPLRTFSLFGGTISFFTLIIGIYYLVRYLNGSIGVPGFTTNVLLISFFGGMTLVGIGLIGEYLDRVVREVRGAPRWHIREVTPVQPVRLAAQEQAEQVWRRVEEERQG